MYWAEYLLSGTDCCACLAGTSLWVCTAECRVEVTEVRGFQPFDGRYANQTMEEGDSSLDGIKMSHHLSYYIVYLFKNSVSDHFLKSILFSSCFLINVMRMRTWTSRKPGVPIASSLGIIILKYRCLHLYEVSVDLSSKRWAPHTWALLDMFSASCMKFSFQVEVLT